MEQRLSFITLGVADLHRSRAFYQRLGWVASRYGEGAGIVFFQLTGMVMGLFPRDELAADAGLEPAPLGGFGGITLSHNVRVKAEADVVLAEAVAAGGRVLKPMHDAAWGGYVGYFADPDGHPWEVCFNPHATIAEDGGVRLGR